MKIISITGRTGSGKSSLANMLSQKWNCNMVNIDKIGHQATSDPKIAEKLCEVFGDKILGNDKKIDRKKLGNIVFSDKEKMDILTNITWGYMQNILDAILEKEQKDTIILEWALLPISKYWEKSDIKILIISDDKERKNKVIERDNITEEYFLKRDLGSIDYTPYKFDFVFQNDYKQETLNKMVKVLSNQE